MTNQPTWHLEAIEDDDGALLEALLDFPDSSVEISVAAPDIITAVNRFNSRGTKITFVRSGVVIPDEMTSGATAAAFDKIAGPLLKERVDKAILKLLR